MGSVGRGAAGQQGGRVSRGKLGDGGSIQLSLLAPFLVCIIRKLDRRKGPGLELGHWDVGWGIHQASPASFLKLVRDGVLPLKEQRASPCRTQGHVCCDGHMFAGCVLCGDLGCLQCIEPRGANPAPPNVCVCFTTLWQCAHFSLILAEKIRREPKHMGFVGTRGPS